MKEYRIGIHDRSRGGYLLPYEETTTDIFTALVNLDKAILDIANYPDDEVKKFWDAVILDEEMYEVHGTYDGIGMDGKPFIIMY